MASHCRKAGGDVGVLWGIEPPPPELVIDAGRVEAALVRFLRTEFARAGFRRAVLGLSGGIDSATVAGLAARALGRRNVTAFFLPCRASDPASLADARLVARTFGILAVTVDITPAIDFYFRRFRDADRRRRGNKMARERMAVLFDQARARKALVLGTSNRTEILLGYGTVYGDTACSLNPIGNLYKTQLCQLAAHLGVPERVRFKHPTADLWTGQTDEGELGFSYAAADRLLCHLVDRGLPRKALLRKGFSAAFVARVVARIRGNEFKRRMPLVAKLPGSVPRPG
ncbi:MAG: NAD+ synthase [Planctomycetota bacterium]